MLTIDPLTPTIGATISGLDFSKPFPESVFDEIYQTLLQHLVIFIHGVEIEPKNHLEFAQNFGALDDPHPL